MWRVPTAATLRTTSTQRTSTASRGSASHLAQTHVRRHDPLLQSRTQTDAIHLAIFAPAPTVARSMRCRRTTFHACYQAAGAQRHGGRSDRACDAEHGSGPECRGGRLRLGLPANSLAVCITAVVPKPVHHRTSSFKGGEATFGIGGERKELRAVSVHVDYISSTQS